MGLTAIYMATGRFRLLLVAALLVVATEATTYNKAARGIEETPTLGATQEVHVLDDCCPGNEFPKPSVKTGGMQICATCTTAQCQGEQCGAGSPYVCLAGKSKGGCKGDPGFWPNSP